MTKITLTTLYILGKGKLIYRDGDTILEEYEGEFEAGQYHGKGTLVDRHGEIMRYLSEE